MPGASTRNRLTTDGYRPPPKSWEEIFREQQEQQNSVSRNSSNRSVKLSNELMRERHLTSLNSIRKKVTNVSVFLQHLILYSKPMRTFGDSIRLWREIPNIEGVIPHRFHIRFVKITHEKFSFMFNECFIQFMGI